MRILLTSTSFQDTPGSHQALLFSQGFEVISLRGPFKEAEMLSYIENIDGLICGDDEITREVIQKGKNSKLRIISKYGIGLDKIDVGAADQFGIPVTNCPGVNNVTVAEHVFALLLSYTKNIVQESNFIQRQEWKRLIGVEIFQKNLGIIGLGSIGKEVAKRALAFGLNVFVYDKFIDKDFVHTYAVKVCRSVNEVLENSDILSLNLNLTFETKSIINKMNLNKCRSGVIVINTARAGLLKEEDVIYAVENDIFGAYLTDVLDEEPMVKNHPFLKYNNIMITPHIGSRTYESVVRQGTMAVKNLLSHLYMETK